MDLTDRNDIVIDSFVGSGTTIVAAQKTGRIARCTELDPLYVDVAIRRFKARFGIDAIHQETGLTFDALAARRAATSPEETSPLVGTTRSHSRAPERRIGEGGLTWPVAQPPSRPLLPFAGERDPQPPIRGSGSGALSYIGRTL